MRKWIQKKLRSALGVDQDLVDTRVELARLRALHSDLVSIGIDVNFRGPHMILIYSKLNGGQIRHIDAHFENLLDLNRFVKELGDQYQTSHKTWDAPREMREAIDGL